MLSSGGILMGVGMATVFLFLIILIIGMKIMSWIIVRFFPESEIPVKSTSSGLGSANGVELAIAIAAAKTYSKK